MTAEERPRYHPILWWIAGALAGGVAGGGVGVAIFALVVEPLYFSDSDHLGNLAAGIMVLFAVLLATSIAGAIAGGVWLVRRHRRRARPPSGPSPPSAPL